MNLQTEQARLDQSQQQAASFAGLLPRSIRGRLVTLTVGLFVLFMWILVHVSVAVLQDHFDEVLLDQQFAVTQQVAAELNAKLEERIEILSRTSKYVPADLGPQPLDTFLAQRSGMHVIFPGGIAVIGLDGKTIADYPVAPGRRGTFFGDRDYFRQVVASKKPYIDKPIMGRALKRPVLTIAVPVFDAAGSVRAVMTGITDLTAPNFLGNITDRTMAGKGEFFIFSRYDRIFVAATDNEKELTPIPERGIDITLDRFADGFEGSGFGVDSHGIAKLYSGKQVKGANWVVVAALPAEVARRPVTVCNATFMSSQRSSAWWPS